jgi:hypothetical protein
VRKFYYCSDTGPTVIRFETFPDDALVLTNVGIKRADQLQGSTKASLIAPGLVNAFGRVVYTTRHGGSYGNRIFVEQTTGTVGEAHPSRPHAATIDTSDEDGVSIVVTFGTTIDGVSVRPTANEIAGLINTHPVISEFVVAASGGAGDVGLIDSTYLSGGADIGDWRKFNVKHGVCLRINTIEVM